MLSTRRSARASRNAALDNKDVANFRFLSLLSHLADPSNAKLREAAKFELEVVQAAREKGMGQRGIPIPHDILCAGLYQNKRDIISVGDTGTSSTQTGTATGNSLVETHLLVGSLLELLQNESHILGLANKMADLKGLIDIPKEDTIPTAYWLGENDTITASTSNFSTLGLSPHTIAALVPVTRKMLLQSSLSMENYIRRKISQVLALGIDYAALYGTGANNQPTGILKSSGLNTVAFAAAQPTFAELVQMETLVANDNALRGRLAYLANSAFRGSAKTSLKFPATANMGGTIWEPGNTINGYQVEISNQLTGNDVLFGNFEDLLIAFWQGLEMLSDRSVDDGSLKISVFQDLDFRVLRGESFTYGKFTA